MSLATLFKQALSDNNIALSATAQAQLIHYLELMQTWNKVFNLTSITEPREMVYLHLIDSLAVQPFLHGQRCLDVGTGAGLPGIPLAIINPEQHWVLLDKNNKKTRFLTQVIADLGLSNVQAAHSRSEDFHIEPGFDSILSRAFGSLSMFIATTEHLLNPQGKWIAMKGKYPHDELAAIPTHYQVQDVSALAIKGMDIERHIVRIMKK